MAGRKSKKLEKKKSAEPLWESVTDEKIDEKSVSSAASRRSARLKPNLKSVTQEKERSGEDQQTNVLTYGPQLEEVLGSIPEKKDDEELSAADGTDKGSSGSPVS